MVSKYELSSLFLWRHGSARITSPCQPGAGVWVAYACAGVQGHWQKRRAKRGDGEGREAGVLHSIIEYNLETLALCSPQLPVKFI